jgi:antagonist of KipI
VFPDGAVIAITGADLGATVNGRPLEMWASHTLEPGTKLMFGATRNFARGYLAIAGGIQVDPFLGSASTHVLSGLGGFEGRALRKGDRLRIGKASKKVRRRRITLAALYAFKPRKVLRVTEGPQADWFSEAAKQVFYRDVFRVSEESDRVGLRLEGTALDGSTAREMITEGVSLGAVQVTPSGQPIILFVEQQTTGGYPKIANIIAADLHRIGQLRPRAEIRFQRTSLAVARSLWIEQERLLNAPEQLFT